MSKRFEIRSGRRTVSVEYSTSPLQAVVDYVSRFGCKRDEIATVGVDTVAWRGASFSAVPLPPESEPVNRASAQEGREASNLPPMARFR